MDKKHVYLFSYIADGGGYGHISWSFNNKNITKSNINEIINSVELSIV